MEIHRAKTDNTLVLTLNGRLDAAWCSAVEQALSEAVHSGEHRIHLDLAAVDYISSAGLRVLVTTHRQLLAIKGEFAIRQPSPEVSAVFEMCGLWRVFNQADAPGGQETPAATFSSATADWETRQLAPQPPMRLRWIGSPTPWEGHEGAHVAFPRGSAGLGVGAFAESRADAGPRLGEFLALAGCAAQLPPGRSARPDFMLSQEKWVPSVWVTSGLAVEGEFTRLLRFEAGQSAAPVPLAEIASICLSDSAAVFFAMLAETSGLVGASLLEAPVEQISDPFAFPDVRNRLGFTSERAFRETTCLVTGIVARHDSLGSARLRRVGGGLLGHIHAAVFPYRPLQKGHITLEETIAALFDSQTLQSVLHLLNDTRTPGGIGDSEFHRGACWTALLAP